MNLPSAGFDPNRLDGKLNHICTSITYYNFHMFYSQVHLSEESNVLLYIKPDYIWKKGTMFSPINAATSSGAHIKTGTAAFENMFANSVRDKKGLQNRNNKPDNLPTSIQAEVLIEESISLDDILFVVIQKKDYQQTVKEAWTKAGYQADKICVKPDCFAYRNDFIVKENTLACK